MKKIFLFLALIGFLGFAVNESSAEIVRVKSVQYNTFGNGKWQRNNPPGPGQDEFTYAQVYTDKEEVNGTTVFNTYCLGGGGSNCRWSGKIWQSELPLDENGAYIYTEDYVNERIALMENYLAANVSLDTASTGSKSFNQTINGYLIYQNLSWDVASDKTIFATIDFITMKIED